MLIGLLVVAIPVLVASTRTTKAVTRWWWIGATLMLLADLYYLRLFGAEFTMGNVANGLVLSCVFAVAMYFLVATTIDVDPLLAVSSKRRTSASDAKDWNDLVAATPLLIGIFFAFLASVWWELGLEPLSDEGLPQGPSTVDPQFFAQTSQFLPLLILALAFEIRIFADASEIQRAAAVVSLTFLCTGEVLALSVLVEPSGSASFNWHNYSAFVVVVTAGLIGISTIVGALLTNTRPLRQPPEPPEYTPRSEKRGHQAVAIGLLAVAFVTSVLRRRN